MLFFESHSSWIGAANNMTTRGIPEWWKAALTTAEVARLCGVSTTAVINWIKGGKLPAYKTPGGHRRIKRTDLLRFFEAYNIPIPTAARPDNTAYPRTS